MSESVHIHSAYLRLSLIKSIDTSVPKNYATDTFAVVDFLADPGVRETTFCVDTAFYTV
jgi:hypothetical protein